jgi:hypothetical protein
MKRQPTYTPLEWRGLMLGDTPIFFDDWVLPPLWFWEI